MCIVSKTYNEIRQRANGATNDDVYTLSLRETLSERPCMLDRILLETSSHAQLTGADSGSGPAAQAI
jgi:hypothetical protein